MLENNTYNRAAQYQFRCTQSGPIFKNDSVFQFSNSFFERFFLGFCIGFSASSSANTKRIVSECPLILRLFAAQYWF